jgi:hypothetical protein
MATVMMRSARGGTSAGSSAASLAGALAGVVALADGGAGSVAGFEVVTGSGAAGAFSAEPDFFAGAEGATSGAGVDGFTATISGLAALADSFYLPDWIRAWMSSGAAGG